VLTMAYVQMPNTERRYRLPTSGRASRAEMASDMLFISESVWIEPFLESVQRAYACQIRAKTSMTFAASLRREPSPRPHLQHSLGREGPESWATRSLEWTDRSVGASLRRASRTGEQMKLLPMVHIHGQLLTSDP